MDIWELWLLLTCGLIVAVWAVHSLVGRYVARHRARMRFTRAGWDSRQDDKHRIAKRGACVRAGLRP